MRSFEDTVLHALRVATETVPVIMRGIDARRDSFVHHDKPNEFAEHDLLTDADHWAQGEYLNALLAETPEFGIIAEEDGLRKPCTVPGHDAYWTVDPIDGTKAFVQGRNSGIGTMLSLVVDGKVVGAWVGDVCTQTLHVMDDHRPRSIRFSAEGGISSPRDLGPSARTRKDFDGIVGDLPTEFPEPFRSMIAKRRDGGLFREVAVDRGSIGIRLANLWCGAFAGYIFRPYHESPWDNTPLIGFAERLGFVHLRHDPAQGRLVECIPKLPLVQAKTTEATLVVHRSNLDVVREWEENRR